MAMVVSIRGILVVFTVCDDCIVRGYVCGDGLFSDRHGPYGLYETMVVLSSRNPRVCFRERFVVRGFSCEGKAECRCGNVK
ncbi:unnamed protein product [Calypogeia fissa]